MHLTPELMKELKKEYGESFYILNTDQFRKNYGELKEAFSAIYPKFNIAYSYKTNYTPALCSIVNELGGYAEVVSEMELELARRIGVKPENIIWNGPIKARNELEAFLREGGTVHIDSYDEAETISEIAKSVPGKQLNVGIRCNYDVGDGVLSRFGIDTDSEDFDRTIDILSKSSNIRITTFHCHFAKRNIEYWHDRVEGAINVIDSEGIIPDRIDLGGGMFGKMDASLKSQFSATIPTYGEYANVAAKLVADRFIDKHTRPELVIEPGSALVGDCMNFAGAVKTIKQIRNKTIITIQGSQKNISMTGVNPPMEIVSMGEKQQEYNDADIAGFTCIEGDLLYRNFSGYIAKGDMVILGNCGSYSLVMKPPFILPNVPVIEVTDKGHKLIKRKENFEDVFKTFESVC